MTDIDSEAGEAAGGDGIGEAAAGAGVGQQQVEVEMRGLGPVAAAEFE